MSDSQPPFALSARMSDLLAAPDYLPALQALAESSRVTFLAAMRLVGRHDRPIPFHQAVAKGDVALLRCLLDLGVSPDERGEFHIQGGLYFYLAPLPLQFAVGSGDAASVALLLERGADPNLRDRHNWRPLHHAAAAGRLDMVDLLLAAGARANIKTNQHFIIHETKTPLLMALAGRHEAVARRLIEHGADLDAINDAQNRTALIEAVSHPMPDMVRYLLERGANPNGVDRGEERLYEDSPLSAAASAEIVDLLVAAGAEVNAVNKNGENALYRQLARVRGDKPGTPRLGVVEALIRHGIDTRFPDLYGRTPREQTRIKPALALLDAAEADPARQLAPRSERETSIQARQAEFREEMARMVAEMLARRAKTPQTRQKADLSHLHDWIAKLTPEQFGPELVSLSFAAHREEALDQLELFLDAAPDEAIRHPAPLTEMGEITVLHRLIASSRADEPWHKEDKAPLWRFNELVEKLLERGADANAIDLVSGNTPLHCALQAALGCYDEPDEIAELARMITRLLDHGADPNVANQRTSTPLDLARHVEIIELLRARGARHGGWHEALSASVRYDNWRERLEILQRYGADLGHCDRLGDNLLHAAVLHQRQDALLWLLERGLDHEALHSSGDTLLHIACRNGWLETIRHLLNNGLIDPNRPNLHGLAPLSLLVESSTEHWDLATARQRKRDMEATAEFMVECGARVDLIDHAGLTPLNYCRTKKLAQQLQQAAKKRAKNQP